MPNNSIARREKEKKKQDKKKKTVSPPLHKEDKASKDKASMEGASLSLFDTGKDKASKERNSLSLSSGRKESAIDPSDPESLERVILIEYRSGLTQEESRAKRRQLRSEIQKANPGISDEDLKPMLKDAMVKAALEARRRKNQSAKDSSLSLLPVGYAKSATSLSS